jgi:hypothetical protein
MRNYFNAAKAWYVKSGSEADIFNEFISLWISFNILYNSIDSRYEIDKIINFISNKNINIQDQNIILNLESVNYFSTCMDNSNDEKIKAVFKILYQIRCNLFHGDKRFASDSDELVVSHASNILREFLSMIFKSNPVTIR